MNRKALLLAVTLFLSSFTLAYAKSYTVSLSTAARAGKVQLAAGQYELKLTGNIATFTDSHRKSYTAPVKITESENKNPYTTVEAAQDNNGSIIKAIKLGGTKSTLEFIE